MSVITASQESTTTEVSEQQDDVFSVTPLAQPEYINRKPHSTWKITNHLLYILPPFILAASLLIAWYMGTTSGRVNALILPAPRDVFTSLVTGITSGLYWEHFLITVQESLLGFLLAVAFALPIGYGIAKSRLLAHTLQPYLAAGQAIPSIVIAPFLFLWLGEGSLSVIVICMLVVLFPMVVNTVLGIQTIEHELVDAARLEGAYGWSLLANIEFPLALPSVLAAVRTSLTLSITGAIVGEFFCSPDRGLGALLMIAQHQYNMAFMFAIAIILAVMAAIYYSVSWLLVKVAEVVY